MNEEEILEILSNYDLTEDEIEYLYLQLYFINELNNKTDEQIQEFHRIQKENRDSILSEIAKIMLTYTIIDTIMSISDSDKLKLQFRLNELVNKKVQSELDFEYLKTKETLRLVGEHKYYTNSYVNDLGGVKSDKDLKVDYLDKIINAKVDEKLWSDRLWDNKNQTAADLRKEIKKFLNGETTVNQIEDVIKKKYNTNAYETKRLVHTEIARVQEEINQIWAKDHGVKYQMFMATLDYKTSERCRGLDGKVFEFDDVNKPIPPLHPFCRSTLVDIPDKKWRPSERLDNITKERIQWQSYEEWYKNYIENNPVRLSEEKKYKNRFSDKEKYEKYKEILGKEVPESFDKFQELKYNNTKDYKDLKLLYKDVNWQIKSQANVVSGSEHKVPFNAKPNSVFDNYKNGKLESRRYYGNTGKPRLDIDLTDHGNSSQHKTVPHQHNWLNDEANHDDIKRPKDLPLTKAQIIANKDILKGN